MQHRPVLIGEVLLALALKPGATVLDGTLGSAGHSLAVLEAVGPEGRLIGFDQDPEAIRRSAERLMKAGYQPLVWQEAGSRFEPAGKGGEGKQAAGIWLIPESFARAEELHHRLHLEPIDAVILDIGLSSDQLEDASRGFSFERDGPLDMRMDPRLEVSAQDLVNDLSKEALADLFWKFGQERHSRRLAQAVVNAREEGPIETTAGLVQALEKAVPPWARRPRGRRPRHARTHFATRVFQSLRIAVNHELTVLEEGLGKLFGLLKPGGRMVVISFHSLEDRIVKQTFRTWAQGGLGRLVIKKPVRAGEAERQDNPRSRSAKLRVIEKRIAGETGAD